MCTAHAKIWLWAIRIWITLVSNLILSLDEAYWQRMSGIIDSKNERVWDALLDGFEKYLGVLTERSSLIQETDALRQQVSQSSNFTNGTRDWVDTHFRSCRVSSNISN